jgi:ketosteroid isomerase-like protein
LSGTGRQELLRSLYNAFNARDVDTCVAAMTPDVDWANGWEGGRVVGRDAVRDYWQRQWAEIDSTADPTAITERPDGTIEVAVRGAHDHREMTAPRARRRTRTDNLFITSEVLFQLS